MPGQSCTPTDPASRVCVHTHTHGCKRVMWSASSHTEVPCMLSCCLYSPDKAGNTTKPKINRGLLASWGPGLPSLGPGLSGAAETRLCLEFSSGHNGQRRQCPGSHSRPRPTQPGLDPSTWDMVGPVRELLPTHSSGRGRNRWKRSEPRQPSGDYIVPLPIPESHSLPCRASR